MATAFIDQYTAATGDITFIGRVEMATLQTCNNLSSEATTYTNHTNRMTLMKAVTNDSTTWAPRFAKLIASNGIDQSSTDAEIQGQVAASWDAMAGVD